MSYCVNCGVELADSERRCPLCHTEVHNPRQPYDRKIPKPFPNRLDLFEPEDNRGTCCIRDLSSPACFLI